MPKRNWHVRKRYGATDKVDNVSLMLYLHHRGFVLDEIQDGSSLSMRVSNRIDTVVNCPL